MSPAVDQDGDGDLGDLIASAREHLRAPDRAELADGEDLAVGRPLLGGSPVATGLNCLARLARWFLFWPEPGLVGLRLKLGPRFSPRLSCHSVVSTSGNGQGLAWYLTIFAVRHGSLPPISWCAAEIVTALPSLSDFLYRLPCLMPARLARGSS
jgi:hypothetical protein